MNKIAEYSATTAALAELRQRMTGVVYYLGTTKGMAVAKADRAELRSLRTGLESKRVELKAPALEHSRLIDAEAKRLTAEIAELESPIDAQVKAEEARREAEKQAQAAAERTRVAAIHSNIDLFRRAVADATVLTSAQIGVNRALLRTTRDSHEWEAKFAEFADEAKAACDSAIIGLADLQYKVEKQEAVAAQIEADRAELAELKRLQDEKNKADALLLAKTRADAEAQVRAERLEAERVAADLRKAEEADLAVERARLVAERKEAEGIAAELRKAEEAGLAVERARLVAERVAANEKEQAERRALVAEKDRLAFERAKFERQKEESAAADRQRLEAQEATRDERLAELEAAAEIVPVSLTRPTDEEIIECVATTYGVTRRTAIGWLWALDLAAMVEEMAA